MEYTLDQLKAIADKVDYKYHHNVSATTLKSRLEDHVEEIGTTIDEVATDLKFNVDASEVTSTSNSDTKEVTPSTSIKDLEESLNITSVETKPTTSDINEVAEGLYQEEINRLANLTFAEIDRKTNEKKARSRIKEANRLVRCIITSNDRNKNSLYGEIFCVRNAKTPDIKKMIVFGHPTHIPVMMLNMIKEKQVQMFKKEKKPDGNIITKTYLVPAYNIQELPPLTRDEFEAIRQRQLADFRNSEED